ARAGLEGLLLAVHKREADRVLGTPIDDEQTLNAELGAVLHDQRLGVDLLAAEVIGRWNQTVVIEKAASLGSILRPREMYLARTFDIADDGEPGGAGQARLLQPAVSRQREILDLDH